MGLRIVIIEDEPAIFRHLKRILEEIDDTNKVVQVIDHVKTGKSWLLDNDGSYDLIFSDIQLLDGTSFEIFEEVQPKKPIIFVTAYEEYTLEAFNTNGIYYIVKPFQKEEIAKALEKFNLLTSDESIGSFDMTKLQVLMDSLTKINSNYKKAYLVHFQNKLIPIKTEDIAWFFTENEVVYARTFKGKMFTLDSTLERVASELSPVDFIRANRKFVVSRAAIKDIDFYFNGRLIVNVVPTPEQQIIISKAKVTTFKKWMNQY